EIQSEMTTKVNKVLDILSQKNLSKTQKGDKIVVVLDDIFDYSIMSRLALSRTWNKLSKEKRAEFTKVFEKNLKQSYIDKLDLYKGQKVKILGLVPYKKNRLQLQAQLKGAGENYPINYNFYENKSKNEWFVYDIEIAGVSIIKTYMTQFRDQLNEKNINELIKTLKAKN
ncbi:MAG: toluene tolerance protein, partial [Arcobacter sp.]